MPQDSLKFMRRTIQPILICIFHHLVDLVEHSVVVSLLASWRTHLLLSVFLLVGCCGVCPNIPLSIIEASDSQIVSFESLTS